jgi:hypothetical protein
LFSFFGICELDSDVSAAAAAAAAVVAGIDAAEAAGVPIVYGTADLALRHRARLQAGQTVLVLGASGGVGTAAVQARCEVLSLVQHLLVFAYLNTVYVCDWPQLLVACSSDCCSCVSVFHCAAPRGVWCLTSVRLLKRKCIF